MLQAEITKQLRDFPLAVDFSEESGKTLVLVGESGAGKSTILNLLAGLLHPDHGRIVVDGMTLFQSDPRVAVAAYQRPVGYVFQDYALFPHLSVFENVAFGLRSQGGPERAIRPRVTAALEQLGIAQLSKSRPTRLSGGQQQRVALARALVLEPRLLLLDEPLSALDLQTRQQVRTELRRILSGLSCTTVFVTHSAFEAMVFGERIAVVERGRIVQIGRRVDFLRHPRSPYVAGLMGVNLFRGRVAAKDGTGLTQVETADGVLNIVADNATEEIFVAVNPSEVTIHTSPLAGSAQNVFAGRIIELVPEPPFGERIRVVLDSKPPLVAQITAHAMQSLGLREGMEVYASFKATAVNVYA
ncbi:MAG TPA: ABC transporter ATP-binding protein [bacterium]|nr:ABC transporter ATP-binding protein [bacterium]